MDNNQMNGMENNMGTNVQNQVPVDNGINQNSTLVNNEVSQNVAQPVNNSTFVDNGTAQNMNNVVSQQMPMNGVPQQMPMNGVPQQMPMNGVPQQMQTNGMPGVSAPNKSNTVLIIIIIVIGVIILGLAGFIGVSLLTNDSGKTGDNPGVEEVEKEEEEEPEDVGDTDVGQVDNSTTNNVTHNGYTYKVDAGITTTEQNGMLLVRNAAGTVSVQMSSTYGNYSQYLASSEKLKQELVNAGYGTINYETKKYNNRDYMTFSGSYQNIPFQFFIVGLDDAHVIQGMMITKTGNEWADGYNMIEDFVSDVNGTGSADTSSSFSVAIPGTNNGTFFQQIN